MNTIGKSTLQKGEITSSKARFLGQRIHAFQIKKCAQNAFYTEMCKIYSLFSKLYAKYIAFQQ
ncbi:hypothetical protein B7988_10930 [Fibrobacter sp. UWB1]|nr:hypothetical protein B7988_10930 [Fibrobacter sp. UWB1]